MRSLRSRLVAGLLVVSAFGLLVLGGTTYVLQRQFLYHRVDAQVQDALGLVSDRLQEGNAGVPGFPRRDDGPRPGGGPRGGPRQADLPSGTYGERRDAAGRPVGSPVTLVPGQTVPSLSLGSRPPAGHPFTAKAADGTRYRVLVTTAAGGTGSTVVAVPLREVDQQLRRLLRVEGPVIAGVLLVLAGLGTFVVRLGLRPLDRIGATAGAIAGGDLGRRVTPAEPGTEVGRLGLALNAMLDRLERAFAERQASEDRLRRFLADASHELRTPLSSIRGYAELFRLGAARSEADTSKAMRRIEQEAARMGVLVEDLLTLARLDEVRDAVRQEVDLADVAQDAVDDARATAPDRAIALDVADDAVVSGDPHQLGQVLGNLLRNALVHTPGGSPVEVAVAASGEEVRLDVRDHGPGLPTADGAELFGRFWRAEAGRERGRGGAGLGLAIVAGIVEAHGGRVAAADAEGGGARFTVVLPAADAATASAGAGRPAARTPRA